MTLVAGGCLHGQERDADRPALPQGDARSGFVVVAPGSDGAAAAPYVAGRQVFGLHLRGPVRLTGAVDATLLGTLAPVAVPAPRRRGVLAYSSSAARVPLVRAHYATSRYDVVVAKGAISVAWGSRGLAYVEAPGVRLASAAPYAGHVVVRRHPGSRPVRWTVAPAQYVAAAWAGRRLLAYRLRRSWPDLVVFDGPQRMRRLARAGALIAVSPDGGRAFVSSYDVRPPLARVVDVATGREQARLRLRSADARWLIESGSWVGDEVVASASTGLVVFRVRSGTISIAQILRFRTDAFPVVEPRLEADGRHILARVELASRPREAVGPAQLLRCERRALRCSSVASGSSADPPRALYNPSRP